MMKRLEEFLNEIPEGLERDLAADCIWKLTSATPLSAHLVADVLMAGYRLGLERGRQEGQAAK